MSVTTENKPGFFRRHWISISLFAVMLMAINYFAITKQFALSAQAETYEAKAELARTQVQGMLDSVVVEDLKLTTKSLVWAVRSELVRENYEQVGQYFNQFVKAPQVETVTLIRPDGTVWLSSDKKSEGKDFVGPVPVKIGGGDAMTVDASDTEIVEIAAPVMSLDSRLGTLVVRYRKIDAV